MTVRRERPGDAGGIRQVHREAFDGAVEADLVDRLRPAFPEALSLVAEEEGAIAGHLLFTPVRIEGGAGPLEGMGLGPIGVRPRWQRRGVGSALVRRGLEILDAGGCPFVVVLGHPEYYPRFGFEPASRHRVACPWDAVPDAAFMIRVRNPGALGHPGGVARYSSEFDRAAGA